MASAAEAAGVVAVPGPSSLPVAPEAVQQWLRQEDWEALTKAWQDAESQVIAWASGSDSEEARLEELWHEASLQSGASMGSLPPLGSGMLGSTMLGSTMQGSTMMSQTSSKRKGRRAKWDEDFHLLGIDSRKPAPLRRYFDAVPSENSLPRHRRGEGDPKKVQKKLQDRASMDPPEHLKSRRPWHETHHQTVSPDNEGLHPHLRSYFDRRGLESCYRQRPQIDKSMSFKMRPRTPQRPTTREKIMKYKSLSEPSLGGGDSEEGAEGRHRGGIHWGARCQMYNSDAIKIKPRRTNGVVEPIPWVGDHHVSVTYDNGELHPSLRHYFDADGLESSFRNRGMHYGRPDKRLAALGITLSDLQGCGQRKSVESGSSWDSIHSSLLDKLSFSSLQESFTPGGVPVVRKPNPDSPS